MLHKDEKISQMLDVALNDEYLHNTSQTFYINTKKSFQNQFILIYYILYKYTSIIINNLISIYPCMLIFFGSWGRVKIEGLDPKWLLDYWLFPVQ